MAESRRRPYAGSPPRHPRDVSPWLRTALQRLSHLARGVALDIPCGRGRHSPLLIELGFTVVAADLDQHALEQVSTSLSADRLLVVRLNALAPLPFPPETFDLAVVIHPHSLAVLSSA